MLRTANAVSHTQPNATAAYNAIMVQGAPMAAMLATIAAKRSCL